MYPKSIAFEPSRRFESPLGGGGFKDKMLGRGGCLGLRV